ncbi:DsbA family protein [Candidatus Woesearchaeota archaeon]|nr:MAG: DSBA oxidoreductase [archaeon GW2011_AR18]MBS3161215.1 DsbA family protein [Candidatus Woesearchaeota archaeon]HIH25228.1 DsbA family protein [Nanoarchaeota archaeon]
MVLCILALPIFAILSIFSVKYRKLTKDSLECLFKTATLRKCQSGLDERIKSTITGKVMKKSPRTASFFYNNYKIFSFIILLLFLASLYYTGIGIYNYIEYGNCNGPENTGFCMLDPTGANSKTSEIDTKTQKDIILPTIEEDDPIIGDKNAELTIIEFGCYSCPYTKKAEETVKQVLENYKGRVNLQFKTFYIPHHNYSIIGALASNCVLEQNAYEKYHELVFEQQENQTEKFFDEIPLLLGIDTEQYNTCLETKKYKNETDKDNEIGLKAGVRGTPTFFINDKVIVGPKPYRTFKNIIDEELK